MKRSPMKRGTKPMRAASDRRAKGKREYAKKRKAFLEANPVCQLRPHPDCTYTATEISHIAGNGRTGGAGYLDETNWKSACHNGGQWVEHNKKEALARGLHRHGWDYERND